MILHSLNASPASAAYRDCLAYLQPGDALVLMGDGVYAAMAGTGAADELAGRNVELYALDTDARLAGITELALGVHMIDMRELVRLSERYPRQQAWY